MAALRRIFWLILALGVSSKQISRATPPVSGLVNNTVIIVPVDRDIARHLVPAQYALLPVNTALLPGFPTNSHPLILVGGHDYAIPTQVPLLSFSRFNIQIPFVDRLGNEHTPFSYALSIFIDNPAVYPSITPTTGVPATLAKFVPDDVTRTDALLEEADGRLLFRATSLSGSGHAEFDLRRPRGGKAPWPVESFAALANMPGFGSEGSNCYNHIEDIKSSYTVVSGSVSLTSPPLPDSGVFALSTSSVVYGVTALRNFTETLLVDCSELAT